MFNALYFCNSNGCDACADYVVEGVYFTFVFRDGRCYEWSEEHDRIDKEIQA